MPSLRRLLAAAAVALTAAACVIAGYFALVAPAGVAPKSAAGPLWAETKWPFSMDEWGTGRAFVCSAADCGVKVELYLRAKLGSCNCATGIASDADLDRMSDFALIGSDVAPIGAGRPVAVGWMKGRSRGYALRTANASQRSALSVVINDRCDMIVETAVLPQGSPAQIRKRMLEFLNSATVLHWAELALGI